MIRATTVLAVVRDDGTVHRPDSRVRSWLTQARSITGLRATTARHSDSTGPYVYGDFDTGQVWALDLGNEVNTELADTDQFISTFGVGENQELYVRLLRRWNTPSALYRIVKKEPSDEALRCCWHWMSPAPTRARTEVSHDTPWWKRFRNLTFKRPTDCRAHATAADVSSWWSRTGSFAFSTMTPAKRRARVSRPPLTRRR
jgi:hypothetical protein